MITRIHGATSTLAANPRKKHHKRRNPSHARRRRRNPEPGTPKREFGVRAKKQIAKLQEKLQKYEAILAAGPKKRPKKGEPGYVARPYKARPKTAAQLAAAAARKERADFLASHGYRMPKTHEGQLLGYAYPFRRINKKGKKVYGGLHIAQRLLTGKGNKPRLSLYKTSSGYKLFKNPMGGLVVAGVPVIEMAIGSAATIAIGAVAKSLITNVKALEAVKNSPVGDIAGELATAGIAFVLHDKVLKNPMHKSIAQFAFVGAVFQILAKKLSEPIEKAVAKIPGIAPATAGYSSAMSGVYFDPYTAAPATGGYISADSGHMAGIYTDVNALSGGMGLFNAPSIYG